MSLRFLGKDAGRELGILDAGVMELVDVVDSKSTAGDSVPVRVRSPAPPLENSQTLGNKAFAGFLFCCVTL